MSTNDTAANAARFCSSLTDAFVVSFRSLVAPLDPLSEQLTASVVDGNVLIEFLFTNLPNSIVEMQIGETAFRGELAPSDAGSEVRPIVTTVPCGTVFAVVTGEAGFDWQSGTHNGFVRGKAFLVERQEDAVARSRELAAECARRALSSALQSIVAILMQLPVWDACRLLQEVIGSIEDPGQRARLRAIRGVVCERDDRAGMPA